MTTITCATEADTRAVGRRLASLLRAIWYVGIRSPRRRRFWRLLLRAMRKGRRQVRNVVALAVQVYAAWYLQTDDRYGQFAATVSLFTAAMLLVVHSGDLLLTVVGWEVMGWCSSLLIGHWSRRPSISVSAAANSWLVGPLGAVREWPDTSRGSRTSMSMWM